MNEQVTCILCRHCDPSYCFDYQYYCDWLRTYEDPDKAKDCPYFSNSDINLKKRQV